MGAGGANRMDWKKKMEELKGQADDVMKKTEAQY